MYVNLPTVSKWRSRVRIHDTWSREKCICVKSKILKTRWRFVHGNMCNTISMFVKQQHYFYRPISSTLENIVFRIPTHNSLPSSFSLHATESSLMQTKTFSRHLTPKIYWEAEVEYLCRRVKKNIFFFPVRSQRVTSSTYNIFWQCSLASFSKSLDIAVGQVNFQADNLVNFQVDDYKWHQKLLARKLAIESCSRNRNILGSNPEEYFIQVRNK